VIFICKKSIAKWRYCDVVHAKTNTDGRKIEGVTFPSGNHLRQSTNVSWRLLTLMRRPNDTIFCEWTFRWCYIKRVLFWLYCSVIGVIECLTRRMIQRWCALLHKSTKWVILLVDKWSATLFELLVFFRPVQIKMWKIMKCDGLLKKMFSWCHALLYWTI